MLPHSRPFSSEHWRFVAWHPLYTLHRAHTSANIKIKLHKLIFFTPSPTSKHVCCNNISVFWRCALPSSCHLYLCVSVVPGWITTYYMFSQCVILAERPTLYNSMQVFLLKNFSVVVTTLRISHFPHQV